MTRSKGNSWPTLRAARILGVALVCVGAFAQAGAAEAAKCTQKGTGSVDVLKGTNKRDVLCAKGGADVLIGKGGNDVLKGGGGADALIGKAGNDSLAGGPGDDTLSGGKGDDKLKGQGGVDVAGFSDSPEPMRIDLAKGKASGNGDDLLSAIENAIGSPADDELTGDAGVNKLSGGEGNDLLAGGAGDDRLEGQGGSDSVSYAAAAGPVIADLRAETVTADGTDSVTSIENLTGSAHDDTIGGDDADNVLDGGPGRDLISFASAPAGVDADLGANGASGDGSDTLRGFEDLAGSEGADRLTGDGARNVLSGTGGDDTLIGLEGDDDLQGGAGADTAAYVYSSNPIAADLRAGTVTGEGTDKLTAVENVTGSGSGDTFAGDAANNVIDGGSGADTISFAASPALIDASLATGVTTGDGQDTVLGIENAIGSPHNDSIAGNSSANAIAGGPGNDTLAAGDGNDQITGEDGNDRLFGDLDDDVISGGPGDDHLDGGSGVNDCNGGAGTNTYAGNCDGTPPVLTAFTISPGSVDTETGQKTIDFTLTATDDSAGVDPALSEVIVHAPAGNPTFADSLQLTSGDDLDGTYSASITLPQYSAQGTWTVDVKLVDQSANQVVLTSSQLASAGRPHDFQQTGAGDTAAPVLSSAFVTSPTTIDTSGAPRVVGFDFDATDDLAGVDPANSKVIITGPTGATFEAPLQLVSGDGLDGSYHAQVTIPQFSAPGAWTVQLLLVDSASNQTLLTSAQLGSGGSFTQSGSGDTTAPTLTGFVRNPASINTAEVDQVIDFNVFATDDLAGIDPAASRVTALDPVNQPRGESPLTHVTGNEYSASITIPQGSATGTWKLEVKLVDRVGNVRTITSAELQVAGLPGTFQNVAPAGA